MNQMTDLSVQVYRQTVRENPNFVSYLRTVTPELELQMLPLGSRPAKRKVSGGIESLRAIPWVAHRPSKPYSPSHQVQSLAQFVSLNKVK